jgi:hypothetical protein
LAVGLFLFPSVLRIFRGDATTEVFAIGANTGIESEDIEIISSIVRSVENGVGINISEFGVGRVIHALKIIDNSELSGLIASKHLKEVNEENMVELFFIDPSEERSSYFARRFSGLKSSLVALPLGLLRKIFQNCSLELEREDEFFEFSNKKFEGSRVIEGIECIIFERLSRTSISSVIGEALV